ncbi:NADPH-dependent F420 reductase [Sphingopyxis sp. MC1]|mgnify:CR=1 FL=1|uniref:NADPH-dependent F420 reductase n=1 Tax=Sphingopyxis sp. MC1 TaxID=1174684 RepID=UPI0002D1EF7A|nr:NAD(P)-binding domain-containing protein [Sphingopyxis sp. MC1]ENY80194.1 coenzyme F420-dependent NADP oxidoreductase [Sphingopyxis sp. MC1]
MKIGIVGAGYVGRAVAELASRAGCEVRISNSRGPRTLSSVGVATGATPATIEDAVAFADIVLVAIPFANREDLPAELFARKIVIDANNYYPQRDGNIDALDAMTTTTSELMQAALPGARLVKGFNAILATDIVPDARPTGTPDRRALPIAGDDAEVKAAVAQFHDLIGFDAHDAGSLADSWRFERAKPAYCVALDEDGLVAALAAADRAEEAAEGSWRG